MPNGDLFQSLRNGGSSVVTDQIETFTRGGIKLKSGVKVERINPHSITFSDGTELPARRIRPAKGAYGDDWVPPA